jgi:hypothetical protein
VGDSSRLPEPLDHPLAARRFHAIALLPYTTQAEALKAVGLEE